MPDLPTAGFPNCPECPYVVEGSAAICVACAGETIPDLSPPLCPICSQTLEPGKPCANRLCSDPGRSIDHIYAIAAYSNDLRLGIVRLKRGGRAWALVFGRLVIGYLQAHELNQFDLVIPNPTYVTPGAQFPGHTELVLQAAEQEDQLSEWNWVPDGLNMPSPKPQHGSGYSDKRDAAAGLEGLLVLSPELDVAGASILIYDDVCTTGLQLDAVSRFAKSHGASRVEGLVLARTQWAT